MKKSIIGLLSLGLVAGAFTSCQDMMTVETGDKTYTNAQDTLYSYLGIMRCMQDIAERQVILGEIRGDLVSSSDYTTDTLYAISNFDDPKDQSCSMLQVSDYYNVINNCNFYIQNADTSAVKSNIKYMIPEYAQVLSIRAWAYLQLVKNYGTVPYITEPVSSLDVIKNFDYSANLVSKDNLVDRLLEDGLEAFVETRYPQYGSSSSTYGSWNNGYTDISARLCYVPIRVVLGDLYLLRGGSISDFEKAAKYYYDYLKNESTPLYKQYTTVRKNNGNINASQTGGWGSWASTYSYSEATNEVISLIPGSANAALGKMLTRVSDIYGYTPSSAQYSDASTDGNGNSITDANGNTQYDVAGAISVSRNWKRQYGPSLAYKGINYKQNIVNYTTASNGDVTSSVIEGYDGRYSFSVEDLTYEGNAYPLCSKSAKGAQFYYTIPTYRKTLIWLRLAEAINRAGYPEFAFAILKDGINQYSLPKIADLVNYIPIETIVDGIVYKSFYNSTLDVRVYVSTSEETGYYYYNENNEFVAYEDKISGNKWKQDCDTLYYRDLYYGSHDAMYYVTDTLQLQSFNSLLNFNDEVWNSTYGIHAKGGGFGNWTSSNTGEVTTNISGTRDEGYYDYFTLIKEQGVDAETASKDDIINAVENIIVDELALETAFEGNRFTDLIRIAGHKNAAGFDGTEWLARKIANRGYHPETYETPEEGAFDDALYAKLKNQKNWYFSLPTWSVK